VLTTLLWYVVAGAVIGVVARLVLPGRNPIGAFLTILVGIGGAVLGGVVSASVGGGDLIAFIFAVIIAAFAVAVLTGARGGGLRGGWRAWNRRRRAM
jgi:uncharacterized membrane protein YeaQ/YmgE (transglycosylase-associated protein family)